MWSPDDLDIGIIKAMASPHSFQWDVRISYANVAKGLSVDEETVRNRLRHMSDAGFLLGWQLILNPMLLGRKAAIIETAVTASRPKAEIIKKLSLLEGVTLIEDFYGDELAIHLLYENEDALIRQVQLIAFISGCQNPIWWRLGFPNCTIVPTRTEWRIIRALRMKARGRISDVASEMKISSRTVKRHLMRLVEGNAFYLDPLLDVRKVGGIRCRFWVVCDPDEKHAIDEMVLNKLSRIISTNTATSEHSLYMVHCANASELQEISQWLARLNGVKEVRSSIDVEHIHVQEWMVGEIEKRL